MNNKYEVINIVNLQKIKGKKKKEKAVTIAKPNWFSRKIVIGDIIKTKTFDSFDEMRKATYRAIAVMREDWLTETLALHGTIHISKDKEKREVQESLLENGIRIERDDNEDNDSDKIYKNDVLIGEWNNKHKFKLDFDGRMIASIEYYIKPLD